MVAKNTIATALAEMRKEHQELIARRDDLMKARDAAEKELDRLEKETAAVSNDIGVLGRAIASLEVAHVRKA